MIRPCPRCQNPLEIPTPIPDQIVCSKCAAVIKYKKKDDPKGSPAGKAPEPAAAGAASSGVAASGAASAGVASAGAASGAADQWFYAQEGQQPAGPVQLEELKRMVGAGTLSPQDRVWREGMPSWLLIPEVKELNGSKPAAAGAAPAMAPVPVKSAPSNPFADLAQTPAPAMEPSAGAATPLAAVPLDAAVPAPSAEAAPRARKTGGFLSGLHSRLPKPVLFGFYGALGGLLGALILGEVLWLFLHPQPPEEKLEVDASPTVTLYPSSGNDLVIKVARQQFEGPVRIDINNVPASIKVTEIGGTAPVKTVTIPAGKDEAGLRFTPTPGAAVDSPQIELHATTVERPQGKKDLEAQKSVRLEISDAPASLHVSVSRSVTVYAGWNNSLNYKVIRRLLDDPVRLEVLDLPRGVNIQFAPGVQELPEKKRDKKAPEKDGKKEVEETGEIKISVAPEAVPATHTLLVEARSLFDHRIVGRTRFKLVIEQPPGDLKLGLPKEVIVYPGTENKFAIKLARRDAEGDIHVAVERPPENIDVPAIDILVPAGDKRKDFDGAMVVSALKHPPVDKPYEFQVSVKATMGKFDKQTAIQSFKLIVAPLPPTLQLAVSPRVSAYPGGKASFGVKVVRNRFKDPVRVEIPAGGPLAKPAFVDIKEGSDEGTLEFELNRALLAKKLPMKVSLPVAAFRAGKGDLRAADKIEVEVLAPTAELAMTVSPEVEITQGSKCKFTIRVKRHGFAGPVQVQFNNVPKGVTLNPMNKAVLPAALEQVIVDGDATTFAEPGKYKIEAVGTATSADGKPLEKKVDFNLTVKPFDPSKKPPLDIVFVLDVTRSMDPQIAGLRDGIEQFVNKLNEKKLDAQISLVAFRDILIDKEPLTTLMFEGKPFTKDFKVFRTEVGKLTADGGGDEPESSMDALDMAAKLPFRPKSLKIFLLVTDAPPQTKPNSVLMPAVLKILSEKGVGQMHLILPDKYYPVYKPLHSVAKGIQKDLATVTKSGFAALLPELGEEIISLTPGVEPLLTAKEPDKLPEAEAPPSFIAKEKVPAPPGEGSPTLPATAPPATPAAGDVTKVQVPEAAPPPSMDVTPPTPEAPTLQSIGSGATFSEADRTRILIVSALWIALIAAGIALVLVTAQKLYLRQSWPTLGESLKTFLAAFAAGLLAGVIGQWIFQSTAGGPTWGIISRLFAWTILGGLIGAGMAFFVPNLKQDRAALGGCVGGFIGAIGFLLTTSLAGEMLGRWMGGALLGLFIGLMIALAELASRRYWLEVIFGQREIRTVNLGASAISLGSDEKLAGVLIPGAPAKALGFRVDRDKVICEDFTAGSTSQVSPGDIRQVANAKVRVCSAASAQSTGVNLQLYVARNVSLVEGMPLTAEDIPGLDPQGADGVVALVSKRPNQDVYLLRNRSKQRWTVTEANGTQRTVDAGLSIELTSRCEVDFGPVKGTIDPAQLTGGI